MSVNSVLSSNSTTTSSTKTATKSNSEMNMQDFLHLLVVQMENQNPLEPMNDRDFFAQLAQLGQVQGTDKLIQSANMQQAQSYMGQTVTASEVDKNGASTGGTISGVVTGVSLQDGEYHLTLDKGDGKTADVKLAQVTSVEHTYDMSPASYMIGRAVTGVGTVNGEQTSVTGVIIGASRIGSQIEYQVKTSDGTVVPVLSSTIDNISYYNSSSSNGSS